MSELEILSNSKILMVCFGGMTQTLGGIFPFEFKNFLLSTYEDKYDCIFYVDKNQCWYHRGLLNITNNIDETADYLNKKIQKGNYNKVIFMGSSAGGYAAILFGSLCKVNHVVAFYPQTKLKHAINPLYKDLQQIISSNTKYILYGTLEDNSLNKVHDISQYTNITCYPNVHLIIQQSVNLKHMRDVGILKKIIDDLQ